MKKQFTDDEAMDQATRVLLATLSIPDGAENPSILTKHLDIEEQHVANTRLDLTHTVFLTIKNGLVYFRLCCAYLLRLLEPEF